MNVYLQIANGLLSTVYGFGEPFCGDIGRPVPCGLGAITASGHAFIPEEPSVAVAAPASTRIVPKYVGLRVGSGPCKKILVNDKMNPRYIGERGFDLSPAAVELLTGKPATPRWSGKVYLCEVKEPRWDEIRLVNVSRLSLPLPLSALRYRSCHVPTYQKKNRCLAVYRSSPTKQRTVTNKSVPKRMLAVP